MILGEKPGSRVIAAVPIVLTGIVLISGVVGADAYGSDPALGVLFGVLTAIAYSAFLLVLRAGNRDTRRPAGPLFDATASAALACAVAGLALGELDLMPSWPAHGWLLLLAVTAQVFGWLVISVSLPRLPAARTSLLLTIQPAAAVIFAMILVDEQPSRVQLLGIVVVLMGILWAAGEGKQPNLSQLDITLILVHSRNGVETHGAWAYWTPMTAADIDRSLEKIRAETSVSRLLNVTCAELAAMLDASRCSVSRIIGDLLVELSDFHRSGDPPALELFLVSDYPLTQEVIDSGEPRVVLRNDPSADPAETALLERLGLDSLLMLPLRSRGQNWGSSRSTPTIAASSRPRSSWRSRRSTGSESCSRRSRAAPRAPKRRSRDWTSGFGSEKLPGRS